MEQFASIDYFTEKECMLFINIHYPVLLEAALFKVKKYMIPCMLAMAKHI